MPKLIPAVLLLWTFCSSARAADLCAPHVAALKQAGKQNILCNPKDAVQFLDKTFSADYQNPRTEPLSAPVGKIALSDAKGKGEKIFQNTQKKDYGIKQLYWLTENYRPPLNDADKLSEDQKKDAYGAPTTSVLLSAFQTAYPEEKDIPAFIQGDLSRMLTANPSRSDWNGRCMLWSAWNVSSSDQDVEFKNILRGMERGRLCDGQWPLSRGVLKEIWTALTPAPLEDGPGRDGDYQKKALNHYYDEQPSNTKENVEDANLALIKLQDFGTGSDFKPDSLVALAKDAHAKGEKLIFDMNTGVAVWNQPLISIVEVSYTEPNEASNQDLYLVSDLKAANGSEALFENMLKLENALRVKALTDDDSLAREFCNLRKLYGQSCEGFPATMRLSDQVDQLKQLQRNSLKNKTLTLNSSLQALGSAAVVHHQIYLSYGTEGSFGDSTDVPAKTRVLEFVKVGDRAGAWSASSKKLSAACASGQFGERDKTRDTLFAPVPDACVSACPQASLPTACQPDRDIFTGSLPPKSFKLLRQRDPGHLSSADQKKINAQKKLLQLLKEHCPSYDQAAVFLDHLKEALKTNALAQEKVTDQLAAEYAKAKPFLDKNFVGQSIYTVLPPGTKPESIPGLDSFLNKLK